MERVKAMNANHQQAGRIDRCYRYIHRHNPGAPLEGIAREWISRYSRRWRQRYQPKTGTESKMGRGG